MGVAPTVAMGHLADGSISILACSISNYLCTNFGAFIKSAQSISLSALLFLVLKHYGVTRFLKLYVTKVALLGSAKVVFKLFTSLLDNL